MNKYSVIKPLHLSLYQLGKRSIKPGGIKHARSWLRHVGITPLHDVLEICPGSGTNTREILRGTPRSYCALFRKGCMSFNVNRLMKKRNYRAVEGFAEKTGLGKGCFDVVVSESIVSTYRKKYKPALLREAHRVLKPGGLYAIHEIAASGYSDDYEDFVKIGLLPDKPLEPCEWKRLLNDEGFEIKSISCVPYHLFEKYRLVEDEGVRGALRIGINTLINEKSKTVLHALRKLIRHHNSLCGITIIAQKRFQ